MDATAVKNIECDDEEARKLVAMILDKCLKEQRENNGPRIEEECRRIEETAKSTKLEAFVMFNVYEEAVYKISKGQETKAEHGYV